MSGIDPDNSVMGSREKRLYRLLVIDDEPHIVRQVALLLRNRFLIHAALSGAAGLEKIRDLRPDLVLADRNLRDMLVDDLLTAIRNNPSFPSPPVLVITVDQAESTATKLKTLGAFAVLHKPVSPEPLLNAVLDALQISGEKPGRNG